MKLDSYCLSGDGGVVIKNVFFKNLMLPWQPNNWPFDNRQIMITAKYGLHHFTGYGENAI